MLDSEIKLSDIRILTANFNTGLVLARNKLNKAKETQAKREELLPKVKKAKECLDELETEIENMKIYRKLLEREDGIYQDNRTSFMESQIEESVARIFPTKNYKVNLKLKPFRGKLRASLTLKDKSGRISRPKMGEGKFCQQLISYSASCAISKTYSVDKICSDEVFSASSPGNLSKVGGILKDSIESGIQMILVEQQTEVYKDLPRREIHLKLDDVTLDVLPPEIIDY